MEPARGGVGGLKGVRLRRDGPFQCQFTAIPAVKNEREKSESTSHFLRRSFSLIQLDLSIPYLWHTGSIHPIALLGVGER